MDAAPPPPRALALEELARLLPPEARLLGLDIGKRRIGIAISDSARRLAVPLTAIPREKGAAEAAAAALEALAEEHNVPAYIVGLPLHASGEAGARVRSVRSTMSGFAKAGWLRRPWSEWDERLSTLAVARTDPHTQTGGPGSRPGSSPRPGSSRTPSKSDKTNLDPQAATWILQGALDRLRSF